jgi:hypothetical protein
MYAPIVTFLVQACDHRKFLFDEYHIAMFPVDEYAITVCRVHRYDHRHLVFVHKFHQSKFILDNGCKNEFLSIALCV